MACKMQLYHGESNPFFPIHACSTVTFVRTALPKSLLFLRLLLYSVLLHLQQCACHFSCPFTKDSDFCVPQVRFQTTQ